MQSEGVRRQDGGEFHVRDGLVATLMVARHWQSSLTDLGIRPARDARATRRVVTFGDDEFIVHEMYPHQIIGINRTQATEERLTLQLLGELRIVGGLSVGGSHALLPQDLARDPDL